MDCCNSECPPGPPYEIKKAIQLAEWNARKAYECRVESCECKTVSVNASEIAQNAAADAGESASQTQALSDDFQQRYMGSYPSPPAAITIGSLYFDTTSSQMFVWNGTVWQTIVSSTFIPDGDKGDITTTGLGATWTIDNDAVTFAKMQNISTDRLLGRATAGAGDIEEIVCTAAGRALLDDADAGAQRTTLGLGTLATQSGTFSGTSSGTNSGDLTLATSVADVVNLTGQVLSADDPGADRIVFWDDSAGKLTHLDLGSNALTIDGTTLKSQPLFPVEPISRGAAYISYIGGSAGGNSSAAVNASGGFVLFAPVYIRKSANYTTYSVGVATAGSASSLGRMALYTINAADALPGTLVCQSGTFTTDSTGLKQPTMASTFVNEGWYYMGIGTNSTTNVLFYGDTMVLLRGVFSGSTFNTSPFLLDYSQKLYADLWPNPWNGTGSTFRNAFHPITSLT